MVILTIQINNFVEINMQNVNAIHGDLTKYGHAIDPTGVRLTTNPKSMRQLQNSSPLLPFGELDKLIAVLEEARGQLA